MAAALFARKDQIHFFSDMGYMHPPFQHCPYGSEWVKGRCSCNPQDSFGASELLPLYYDNAANDAVKIINPLHVYGNSKACSNHNEESVKHCILVNLDASLSSWTVHLILRL